MYSQNIKAGPIGRQLPSEVPVLEQISVSHVFSEPSVRQTMKVLKNIFPHLVDAFILNNLQMR